MLKINRTKFGLFLKKYAFPAVLLILIISLFYELAFIYRHLQEAEIDESIITAREERIDEASYDKVIEKNNRKKQVDLLKINRLNNPF